MKALICGKYELSFILPPKREDDKATKERSYLHYIAANPNLVSTKCLATEWMLKGVKASSVVEYFGGVGLTSTLIREIVKPKLHTIFEIDKQCVAQLKSNFSRVKLHDAKNPIENLSEFQVLDFAFTLMQIKPWIPLLENVFQQKPKYVWITDTTVHYFKTNRKHYEKFFNKPIKDFTEYLKAESDWFLDRFGYSIKKVAIRGGTASYLLLVPNKGYEPITIREFLTDKTGAGFRFLET
jgi:hypothetical protein